MKTSATFAGQLQQLALRHSVSKVFSDFLEISACALSLGAMEDRYLEIINQYKKSEVDQLVAAFALMVTEMDNHGEGMKDVLGDFFMQHISHGHNGQFFTPEAICEMIARMTGPEHDQPNILDPACGSGRMLMASARINRKAMFFGADIDRNCCMMAAINFCLNGMFGEVAWMDSLSNRFYGGWQIRPYPGYGNPYLVPITEKESVIYLKMLEMKKPAKVQPKASDFLVDPLDELVSAGSLDQSDSALDISRQLSLF